MILHIGFFMGVRGSEYRNPSSKSQKYKQNVHQKIPWHFFCQKLPPDQLKAPYIKLQSSGLGLGEFSPDLTNPTKTQILNNLFYPTYLPMRFVGAIFIFPENLPAKLPHVRRICPPRGVQILRSNVRILAFTMDVAMGDQLRNITVSFTVEQVTGALGLIKEKHSIPGVCVCVIVSVHP